jgi:hypothetical protein
MSQNHRVRSRERAGSGQPLGCRMSRDLKPQQLSPAVAESHALRAKLPTNGLSQGIRIMTDYGTVTAAAVRTARRPKTAGHAERGPAVDPVGRGNDRMVAGSHYRLPERRDLGQ